MPTPIKPGVSFETIVDNAVQRKMLGDIQKVESSNALGTLGMLGKQLNSIGLTTLSEHGPNLVLTDLALGLAGCSNVFHD